MVEKTRAEASPLSQKERGFLGTTREVYCQILGCQEMPKSSQEMPDNVFLPPEVLGDMEEVILESEKDNIERSQIIDWKRKKNKFEGGKVFIGTPSSIGEGAAGYHVRRSYTAPKAILAYHTHPTEYNPWFSEKDLSKYATSRLAFIYAVSSSRGIIFLFQTKKAARRGVLCLLPIVEDVRYYWSHKRLKDLARFEEKIGYLEDLGLICYKYGPPARIIQGGELKKGIAVQRIKTKS